MPERAAGVGGACCSDWLLIGRENTHLSDARSAGGELPLGDGRFAHADPRGEGVHDSGRSLKTGQKVGRGRSQQVTPSSSHLGLTWDRGGDSLEGGVRGGGVTGVLAGEVSGEASVEKGDCLRRTERSSEGREERGGGLKLRPFPRQENGGGTGQDRCRRDRGVEQDIRSITSSSKEGSRSRTGLMGGSSSSSSTSWFSLIGCCSAAFSCFSEGCDWCSSLVGSVGMAIGSIRLCG